MKTKADLVVHDAIIYTVDKRFSVAQAFAVKDGRIIAVGTDQEIAGKYDAAKVVDAAGRALYPGFIDAHAHFFSYGRSLQSAGLAGTKSWDEVLRRVDDFANTNTFPWIIGRGWDQNDWPGQQFPDNSELNARYPGIPVLLTRIDGHAAIANQAALEAAGISAGGDIQGGEFQTTGGKLTGLLVDNAVGLVSGKIPPLMPGQKEKCLLDAQRNCFAAGLTTIADCGLDKVTIDLIDSLQKTGKLKMRLYVMLADDPSLYAYYLKAGPYKTDYLNVRAFKLFSDGALGSRGACLLEPYQDRPGWNGFLLKSQAYFDSIARLLIQSGFQMCTHAIGDAANRMILHVYARVLKGKNDRRWRIEHAQILNPADIPLFGHYNIIPSVQPTHATSDMYWAVQRLGADRLAGAYAVKALMRQNAWIPLGTDFPVEDIHPMKTFYAAVTRQDSGGYPPGGFLIQNALTREEALRGMTLWAAKAGFEEDEKGSVEPGKFADFVILDRDIMQAPMKEVLQAKVLATFLGGEQVYGD
ncbi:MAG TPA: amidohydrolase [Chitinophagaceae bacterium]|nr:amidohydrolase [Chitinophagaceae bacterium]